jgi:DNA polymerase III subunit alpha
MEVAAWFEKLFGERYFIEIMNNGVEIQRLALEGAVGSPGGWASAGGDQRLPLRRSRGRRSSGRDAVHQHGQVPHRHARMKMDGNQYFLRSPQEMYDAFPAWKKPSPAASRSPIRSTSTWSWASGISGLFAAARRQHAREYLRDLCLQGLRERYADVPEMWTDGNCRRRSWRLDRELGVINKLGFPNYFLIVWDFVRQARDMGVPATASRQRRRGAGLLRAVPEPRLPDPNTTCCSSGFWTRAGWKRPISTSTSAKSGAPR